jgi:predicted Zn-dependent protease
MYRNRTSSLLLCVLLIPVTCGCARTEDEGAGPGHRPQKLALTPRQELDLGRQAYREILSQPDEYGRVLPSDSPVVQRVRGIVRRLVRAVHIEPLQREINLLLQGYRFEWEVNVLRNKQVNAFCLPAGKMIVFTGILPVAQDDDQLATVLSHEMSHALAHHASERVARQQQFQMVARALNGGLPVMEERQRRDFFGVLAAGAGLRSKAYDRQQESEADHIGLFLMTFAGYDPEEAVRFWQRMEQLVGGRDQLPEILSDHPSNARRIHDLQGWVRSAKAAKRAYEEGHIAPARD